MTDKTIQVSIKQRVPLDIFCCTLADYLNKGEINEQYLFENLHSVFSGEYNIKLTFNYIKSSILNPLINETLVQNKTKILAALRIPFEANVIAISLINVRFPFCYYFTALLAKYMRLETELSRDTINKLVGKDYPLNGTCKKAIRVSLTQLIDMGVIKRIKIGLYAWNEPISVKNKITAKLWADILINHPFVSSGKIGAYVVFVGYRERISFYNSERGRCGRQPVADKSEVISGSVAHE